MRIQYSAILCEGAAEEAIIEILLEYQAIIIDEEYLIDGRPLRIRSADDFCDRYLVSDFEGKVNIYRILDSKNEKFSFKGKNKKIAEEKCNIYNIYTAPEIEMLIIVSEGHYKKFKNSSIRKPSDYCKIELKMKKVKEYQFVKNYFSDIKMLLRAICEYHRVSPKQKNGGQHLYDLLKEEFK